MALVFSYASHLQEFTFISNPYFKRVKEIADRLGSAHVLYDVIVFGDGEILPEFIGEPKKYPRLLVPECEVTRAQRKLIDSLGERAIFVKDLKELKIPSMLSTYAPKEVYFSLNKTPERTYLQLLNYDYDKRRDEMRPKSFEFSLKLPHEIERAGFRGESGKADLKVDGKNLKGNVKDLVHFGFVRMKNRYL